MAEKSAAKEERERETQTQRLSVRDILEKPQKVKKLMESEPILFSEEDREKDEKSPLWYKEFEENLREENEKEAESNVKNISQKESKKEETKYLSPMVRASIQRSNNIYNAYKSGEEWLMSEDDEDLIKGIINNIRSAIGTGVEELAYAINDFAPRYKPAKDVLEKNTAGKIAEKAQEQFENAKEKGVGENLVNGIDRLSKNAGYNIFGAKAGNYIEALSEGFGEYKKLREQGYSKEEAINKTLLNIGISFVEEKLFDKTVNEWLNNQIPKGNVFRLIYDSKDFVDIVDNHVYNKKGDVFLQKKLNYIAEGQNMFIPEKTKFETVVTIAGNGSKKSIRDIKRLVSTYGGNENNWKKQSGKIESDKYIFDIHWYELDSVQYEAKLKNRKERG